jgi:hydrogenase nickel incorporation protein HypA/HybF
MHEMSIAVEIVEQCLRIAAENNVTHIDEVDLEIGVLRRVVPEAMELAFQAAGEGTLAAGAKLRIHEERLVAVCGACDCMFCPSTEDFTCTKCGAAEPRIVAGNDIIIKSLVCQAPEDAPVEGAPTT